MEKKIVIVDDDIDLVDAMKIALEANGIEVITSCDADSAIELIKVENPDVIILDVMFPENPTTGFELCRSIREESEIKDIPIIILSAINEKFNMAFSSTINSGLGNSSIPADKFLEKPIKPKELISAIEDLCK